MAGKIFWFALYTRPRYEIKVNLELESQGYETYLPLQKTIRQWRDRKKTVTEPLFKSYCFIRTSFTQYLEPLKTKGVVKYVWYEGKPAVIKDKEIENIKLFHSSGLPLEVSELNLYSGQHVTIKRGPLKGITGEIVNLSGKNKVLIRIESIKSSLLATLPKTCLMS